METELSVVEHGRVPEDQAYPDHWWLQLTLAVIHEGGPSFRLNDVDVFNIASGADLDGVTLRLGDRGLDDPPNKTEPWLRPAALVGTSGFETEDGRILQIDVVDVTFERIEDAWRVRGVVGGCPWRGEEGARADVSFDVTTEMILKKP